MYIWEGGRKGCDDTILFLRGWDSSSEEFGSRRLAAGMVCFFPLWLWADEVNAYKEGLCL